MKKQVILWKWLGLSLDYKTWVTRSKKKNKKLFNKNNYDSREKSVWFWLSVLLTRVIVSYEPFLLYIIIIIIDKSVLSPPCVILVKTSSKLIWKCEAFCSSVYITGSGSRWCPADRALCPDWSAGLSIRCCLHQTRWKFPGYSIDQ